MRFRPLITGALGFIGSHLMERFRADGVEAVGVDSAAFNGVARGAVASAIVAERRARSAGAVHELDVRSDDFTRLLSAVEPTHVIHLAGLSRTDLAGGFGRAVHENVGPTQALVDALSAGGGAVQRLVLISSSLVYGDFLEEPGGEAHPCAPVDAYGASKVACEVLATTYGRRAGREVCIVRPSAVYGPDDFNERVVERFVTAALAGAPMALFDGGAERLDFTFVSDLVDGLVRATTAPGAADQTFNLTAGDARSIVELARIVSAYVAGATTEERVAPDRRPRRGTLAIAKARRVLGYDPKVSLEEGVRRVLAGRGHAVPRDAIARVSAPPPIALSRPSIGDDEHRAVARVLRRGWLADGPETRAFESDFAAYFGGGEAIAVGSGYAALLLALVARGIRGEVIVPAFTFAATANAVVRAGATPVFVDIEEGRLGMDPRAVVAAITPRTEAILPVHFAGVPCRIDELARIADRHALLLVEDCAQAAGAKENDQLVGTFGGAGCFSFFPTKNLTTAEGGMLVTRDAAFARRARTLSAHGIEGSAPDRATSATPWHRPLAVPGMNLRMSAVHAALGRVQLARLDAMNAARRVLAARLDDQLAGYPGLRRPTPTTASPVHSLYLVRVPAERRDAIARALRARGIEASVHYDTALVDEAPYRSPAAENGFEIARTIAREGLSLPLHPELTIADVDRVAAELGAALRDDRA